MSGALPFALRDASIFTLTGVLMWYDAAAGDASPPLLAIATGLFGTLCGFLLHEWGHLLGAMWTGSKVAFPRLGSPFLFLFDVSQNGPRQFLAMSYGGYAGSIVALILLGSLLSPHMLSGQVGLGAATLGVLATFVLEVPTTLRVRRGEPLPSQGPAYVGTGD